MWKNFETEDDINTAVAASLHYPNKDDYTTATDNLPCRWEELVGSATDYTE